MGINTATLSGNLGRDPEMRWLQSGGCITSFSIAVQGFKSGEKITNWLDCKVFGSAENHKFATFLAESLKKGSLVSVTGKLEFESWEKEGQKHTKTVLNVRDIQLPAK